MYVGVQGFTAVNVYVPVFTVGACQSVPLPFLGYKWDTVCSFEIQVITCEAVRVLYIPSIQNLFRVTIGCV